MSVNPQVRRGAAFKLACIGKSSSRRFECCATYQNYVFIGTSTGVDFSAVRMSQIVEGEWELASISTIAAANNKPVTQIAVVPELKILLLLSDGKLFIHTFDPTMDMSRPQAMLSPNPSGTVNLRDCVTFALKKHEGTYTLAVALKTKRIAVCVWRLGTFDMSKDLQSPEIPKSMLWLGKRLMLCFSASVKEYCAVEIDTGKVTTLLEAKQTALACYINGFRENLVVSDTIGLRLSESGGTNKKVIRWSLPPKSMIYVHPYLLSLHNAVIEVHFPHIQGKTFCQPLALKNLESFSSVSYIDYDAPSPTVLQPSTTVVKRDAVIALSGDGSMHLLVAYPIKDQVTSLAKERQFEEANDLANLCPNEVSDALKLRLTLLHANHLFEMGNYSDVVAKLTAAKIDPRFMINFFPEYMPEVVRRRWTPPDDTIVQYKSTSFSREATTLVIAYLESWRAGRPNATEHRPPIKEASLENASDVMCAMAAVDTALMHALCDVDQDPGKLIRAPNYIVLEEARKKFLKGSHDYTSFGLLYLALRDWKEMDATLTLLHRIAVLGSDDFSAHLASPDIKGTPLNALMRQLVEAGGVDAGRYYEAAEARRVVDRNMPTLKKEEKDVLVRQFMAVTITAYILKELDGEQPDQEALVLQHSSWLLSSFPPIYATSIFVKDSKKIQPKKVAEFLEPFPSTCNEYLARLMGPDVNSVTDDELHKYRVTALMRLLSDSSLQLAVKAQYTTELTEFLNKSTRYNLQDALRQLEAMPRETNDNLVRAQTIIYRKLGMHQQAVALLLNTNRPRDAENYAREVSDESRRTGKTADAFQYLVKAMLDRTDGTPAQREAEVLSLIGRNPQMDAVAALEVLPDKTKVTDLKTFLINALRASDAQARSQMIKANMLKSTHRSLDVVAAITKSASVRLTRDSKCEVCSRAIGASIFLRFPDGALAHHGCVQDKNVSPDTGRDFTRNVDLL